MNPTGWMVWLCVGDYRTCGRCNDLHGVMWRSDDPNMLRPPLHEGCRCVLSDLADMPPDTDLRLPEQVGPGEALDAMTKLRRQNEAKRRMQ
jgi:hypothetical protein